MPLVLAGATSGSTTIQATDAVTQTITLPNATGTLVVTSGAQTIEFADGSASTPSITNSGDTNTGMFFPAADTIAFAEGGAEVMRIDSSGNVLVGTTNASELVFGARITSEARFISTKIESTNAASTFVVYSTGAGAYRFYVGMGGTVFATNTTITGISDQRVKENIKDLDDGLNAVMALKPRKFDWKEGKGKDIKGDRGFIAQEFETVFPDMIDEWKDAPPEGEEPYKAVNANLIPTLVKAIQEQQSIIESLKTDIAALKAKVGE